MTKIAKKSINKKDSVKKRNFIVKKMEMFLFQTVFSEKNRTSQLREMCLKTVEILRYFRIRKFREVQICDVYALCFPLY